MVIEKINKTGSFYKVFLSSGTELKLSEQIIIKHSLFRKGIEVSKTKLDTIILENEYYLALEKGMKYLKTLHAKSEVITYLKRTYEDSIVLKTVNKLEELKLIDELEFAYSYVAKMKRKGYGSIKIKDELSLLKIPSDFILKAIKNYSYDEEIDNCDKLFTKYLPTLKKDTHKKALSKITNYLVFKGFSNEFITITLEKNYKMIDNINDEDKLLEEAYAKFKRLKKGLNEKEFKAKAIRNLTSKGFQLSKVLKIVESGSRI